MDKKALSERDICTKFITPAITKAGWDVHTQIRENVHLTRGRVIVRWKLPTPEQLYAGTDGEAKPKEVAAPKPSKLGGLRAGTVFPNTDSKAPTWVLASPLAIHGAAVVVDEAEPLTVFLAAEPDP